MVLDLQHLGQKNSMAFCGGLTLSGCQVPTKATLSLPLLSWTGAKALWVEIRTGTSFINYHQWAK